MQDYKLVIRSLVNGATVTDGAGNIEYQNIGEFLDYLREMYLNNGYSIVSVDLTAKALPEANKTSPVWYEFAYHLVKEVETTKKV